MILFFLLRNHYQACTLSCFKLLDVVDGGMTQQLYNLEVNSQTTFYPRKTLHFTEGGKRILFKNDILLNGERRKIYFMGLFLKYRCEERISNLEYYEVC
jgi:hypothetical protein